MDLFGFQLEQTQDFLSVSGIGIMLLELIVRLTPTKKDDGFVQRFGGAIKLGLDLMRVPNIKKKGE